MGKQFIVLLIFAIAAAGAVALQQKLTIYELPNQQGDSVTFSGKYPNLSNWTFFIDMAQSYCITGWFEFFNLESFEWGDDSEGPRGWDTAGPAIDECKNYTFYKFNSGRIVGPPDLYTPALSLFEGTTEIWTGGREIVVTTAASTNFEFLPKLVYSFGNSSWTFFTENNFGGSSWCFEERIDPYWGTNYMHPNDSFPVQSAIKGCDPADVQYYRNLYA